DVVSHVLKPSEHVVELVACRLPVLIPWHLMIGDRTSDYSAEDLHDLRDGPLIPGQIGLSTVPVLRPLKGVGHESTEVIHRDLLEIHPLVERKGERASENRQAKEGALPVFHEPHRSKDRVGKTDLSDMILNL